MEKFYIISNDSKVGSDYWRYVESEKRILKTFDEFAKEHGIKATKFHPSHTLLWIVPEKEDEGKYGNQFTLKDPGRFKKTSAMNKAWVKKCADEGVEYIDKPFVPFLFNYVGRSQYRLFDYDSVIYCTFDCPIDVETPEGFVEMKGSEFYATMEKNNIVL